MCMFCVSVCVDVLWVAHGKTWDQRPSGTGNRHVEKATQDREICKAVQCKCVHTPFGYVDAQKEVWVPGGVVGFAKGKKK